VIVRNAQLQALGQVSARAFEDEMLMHLAAFSPPLYKAVKEDRLRETIRLGVARAAKYGFTQRGPVRLYLELMLLFGSDFDTDPQYPWAGQVLQDEAFGPEMRRADYLYQHTQDYRENVAGPEDAYTLAALRKISAMARQSLPVSRTDFTASMLEQFARTYPEKASYVGPDGLHAVINEGVAAARRYQFSSVRSVALTVTLMFAFGHGCFADTLYPWMQNTVEDESVGDPESRAKRLEKRALTWLHHVLQYFGGDETA
jgi:hypothetical protein